MTLKIDAKFEEKLICCFKNDKNLVNLDPNTWYSQNFHFDWFFLCKVYNIWPKKFQRSYLSWHEEWCKIWKKIDLWFGKWHEECDEFSPEHLKNLKIGTLMGSFYPKWKMYEFKITEELCVMTMKNDAKFEEELTCRFKVGMRNLRNFDLSTQNSQKLTL